MDDQIYVASTYLKVLTHSENPLLETLLDALGPNAEKILEDDYLHGADIERIFSELAFHGVDSWLLRYGQELNIASHGPLGFAVLSAPNLHTALQVLSDYTIIRSSVNTLTYRQRKHRAECIFVDQTNTELMGRWLIESGMRFVQQLTEGVLAHSLGNNASVTFAYPEPDYADELNALFGVECRFNANKNSISFPASWCQASSPLSDRETFITNLSKCRELKLALTHSHQLSESIALAFIHYFEAREHGHTTKDDMPTLQSLANSHHLSSRTLNRHLKTQNTSYKELLAQARKAQACKLLQNTHMTIADVAYNLAYQEPANFVRAFKMWFDTTPAAWRRKQSANRKPTRNYPQK